MDWSGSAGANAVRPVTRAGVDGIRSEPAEESSTKNPERMRRHQSTHPIRYLSPMRNQWRFLVREGFRNLGADRTLSVSSVVTLGVCGAVLSFVLLSLSLLKAVDAHYSQKAGPLRVFIDASHESPQERKQIEGRIRAMNAFDSIVFVDKDEALREFRRDFDEEMTRYLEVNPLPHSFRVYPSPAPGAKPGDPLSGARLRELRSRLLDISGVEEVSGNFTQLEWLDRWRAPLQTGSLALLAGLAAALALIVHNAIKLSLYARRNLVQNMKYCGASGFFILAPFAMEAALLGLMGGAIGALALVGQVQLGRLVLPTLPEWIPTVRLCLYLVGGTVAIALLSSVRTVNAFLRGRLG
jgi:cell division transport system permease protein